MSATKTKKATSDDPIVVEHLTVEERAAAAKRARADVPRSSHAEWEPPDDRADPVELLESQAESRVQELIPLRYGRMLVSPFTFYRGAALIMASDLASRPRTSLDVQLCGDAHLSNFGVYAAPDRRLVFDTNDFDETLRGPFEWDLKRLVASFAVAGRSRGFDETQRGAINRRVVRAYREAMTTFASMRTFDIWYSRIDIEEFAAEYASSVSRKAVKRYEKNVAKARSKDSLAAFAKLTQMVDGEPRFVSNPPLIVPMTELADGEKALEATRAVIRSYRSTLAGDRRHLLERFRLVDAARKVVGVGSVGTRAWILLFLGRDTSDPLILQVKEAQQSVLEPFLGESPFDNHGQRVVEGQRLMQATSDSMLGWLRTDEVQDEVPRDFYVRQLWDSKGSALVDVMEPKSMLLYANICGQTLARAHARSGDAVAIASYMGTNDSLDRALATFAELYADQNDRDYAKLDQAAKIGRIAVETGL